MRYWGFGSGPHPTNHELGCCSFVVAVPVLPAIWKFEGRLEKSPYAVPLGLFTTPSNPCSMAW